MRNQITLAAIALLAMPVVALAQNRDPLPAWSLPHWAPSREVPLAWTGPQWTLPSIGLPPLSMGAQPQKPPIDFQPRPTHSRPNWANRRRAYQGLPFVFYMMAPLLAIATPTRAPEPPQVEAPAKGRLVLQVQPNTAQVFVDGSYVGEADDFDGSPHSLLLEAGSHVVDLDQPGYETTRFNVTTASNESLTYRRELTRVPALPPAPIPSTPVYFIPGCYLGNVLPQDAGLPASCDLSRAVRLK
jgi:hypothetical protein